MTERPTPMTPADCDLRGYEYMPLMGHRLFGSTLYAEASDAEFRASIKLWWSAWNQCPAGSLPNSDAALAMLADYGRDLRGWAKVKGMAMRGFVLCSDGRLYHPILCEAAVKAFELRLKADAKRKADAERLKAWRETQRLAKEKDAGNTGGNGGGSGDETRFTERFETDDETPTDTKDETRDIAERREGKGREEEKKKEDRSLRSLPQRSVQTSDDFEVWWAGYPRKVGKDDARKAYAKARKRGASAAQLLDGLARQRWHEDRQFVPHPATWLNGGRWQDDPDAAAPQAEFGSAWDRMARELDQATPTIEHEGGWHGTTH